MELVIHRHLLQIEPHPEDQKLISVEAVINSVQRPEGEVASLRAQATLGTVTVIAIVMQEILLLPIVAKMSAVIGHEGSETLHLQIAV